MHWLNLGVLAHVDAGKTTLTDRLLYAAGVIDEIGSVDAGTTQTDSLALERQRGITIRSAVASFAIGDVTVNLIDTPGHPDFIAEVERVLDVLDGVVLVISAVEGVQAQTRVLMRALRRLRVPTLLYVNKIDRAGAGYARVLAAIRRKLGVDPVPMGAVDGLGSHDVQFRSWSPDELRATALDVLTAHDDDLLASYVADEASVTTDRLWAALIEQTRRSRVCPVYFGSAATGAGVEPLMAGIADLLPRADGAVDASAAGRVFKIERGPAGEKIVYVRMYAGAIHTRDRLRFDHGTNPPHVTGGAHGDEGTGGVHRAKAGGRDGNAADKVTRISVFDNGPAVDRDHVAAGQIAKVWGLSHARVGDSFGAAPGSQARGLHFDPPIIETVVVPHDRADRAALRLALDQLTEQDPLINVRQDDTRHEVSVSLYGEVQKEVLEATLATDYGIGVNFRETTTICVERPVGTGEAIEVLNTESNPFHATLALRVEPAAPGTGVVFRVAVPPPSLPLFLYKNAEGFTTAMDQHVRRALREGLYGWEVVDCVVTLVACEYSLADGPPTRRGPMPTPADFRNLTPMVVMAALADAGTAVCEPMVNAIVEAPSDAVGAVIALLVKVGGSVEEQVRRDDVATVSAMLPAVRIPDVQRQLPGLTGGEAVLESTFAGYQPVVGSPPKRRRTTVNPLRRQEYLRHLTRRGARA